MAKSLNQIRDRLREQQRERDLRGEHGAPDQPAGRQSDHCLWRPSAAAGVRHLAQCECLKFMLAWYLWTS